MKFVYKIYSGYDRFTPSRIPDRLDSSGLLPLGWPLYLDVVERGHEVWVYFHGPRAFRPGVYVKGFVHRVDRVAARVFLRPKEQSTVAPLSDPVLSARVAATVAQRYRQVFVLPEELEPKPLCNLATKASSCRARECLSCEVWKSLPRVDVGAFRWPPRLSSAFVAFAPAYWVIPSRCYLSMQGRVIAKGIRQTSEVFYRFKVGEKVLGYPLASGICEVLGRRGSVDFDCIVPIPLSPSKEERGEIHRTRILADELSDRLGIPVQSLLRLTADVSKRSYLSAGFTVGQFERLYFNALLVREGCAGVKSALLVDDVCTRGSTLTMAFAKLSKAYPGMKAVAATAGLMITKDVVTDEARLVA